MNYPEGTHLKDYRVWETRIGAEYDYENEGLNHRILGAPVVNSTNPILRRVLGIFEYSIVYWMKSIDILRHFKDVHWKNR